MTDITDHAEMLEAEQLIPKALEAGVLTQDHNWIKYEGETIADRAGVGAARRTLAANPELRAEIWADLAESEHPATVPAKGPAELDVEDAEKRIREAPANLEQVDTSGEGSVLDPFEIAEGVIEGDINPDNVPALILRWLNAEIDIPLVPEPTERRLAEFLAELLKSAIINLIRRRIG